jgi:hypothetical protein
MTNGMLPKLENDRARSKWHIRRKIMRRNTVLLGLRDRLPNYTRQIQIRFGRYQFGQNSNRASLFPGVKLLGNHRGQSQESWMELGLGFGY